MVKKEIPWKKLGTILLSIVLIIQIIPFYITITEAFKPKTDLSSTLLPPTELFLGNFEAAINTANIFSAIISSLVVTIISLFLIVVLGAVASYSLSRIKSKRTTSVFLLLIVVILVPPLSTLVPLYNILIRINGINTYWAIILVMVVTNIPTCILLYVNFLKQIPYSLEEAALIDGCNYIQIFTKILLPTLKPVTSTVIIISGINIWNEYAWSHFILNQPSTRTIAPAVGTFFSSSIDTGAASATTLIASIPLIILFLCLQKYFIKGFVGSGIK